MNTHTLTKLPSGYGTRYSYAGANIRGIEGLFFMTLPYTDGSKGEVRLRFDRLKDAIAWLDAHVQA